MAKRGKSLALAAAALLGLLCAPSAWAANVDTVYTNGKIYPLDDLRSADGKTYDFSKAKDLDAKSVNTVEVVAVKDGKIVFAGSRADAQAQGMLNAAKTVNLQGRTMLPGFIDGHGHFPGQGTDDLYKLNFNSPPLGEMTSIADYVKALNTACENAKPGDGIIAYGSDDTLITDKRHPTWQDIEGAPACRGKNVYITHISLHSKVVSKQMLIDAGLMDANGKPTDKAKNTPGVVIDNGIVTGVLMETQAMGLVNEPAVTSNSQRALARANDVYLAKGVVMGDNGAAMLMGDGAANVSFQTGLANGNLTMRTNIHPILNAVYGGAGNLMALYWEGLPLNQPIVPSEQMVSSGFKPSAQSPKTGDDVTKLKFQMTPNFTPDANLPENFMFLGAYKILGDGSPQAYTAWMKDPGNYDWGTHTAADRFAAAIQDGQHTPIWDTKYDTTKDSAAPTPPPYFNGLPGTVNVYPTDLQNLLEVVHRAGHSTEIHCNGSAYAEAWIEALEKAISGHPEITDTRHCSIHAQTFERNMLERVSGRYANVDKSMTTQLFGALGQADRGQPGTVFDSEAVNGMTEQQLSNAMKAQNIVPNFFITHTYFYGERHKNIFFGPGRANNISPVGWAIALDVPYAFHNDTDVTPIDPLQSAESAVTRLSAKSLVSPGGVLISGTGHDLDATVTLPSRKDANGPIADSMMKFYNYDQRINGAQAMIGVTLGPVYQNKIDHITGTIEEGKLADFVILDEDPIQVAETEPTRMSDIRVTATIIGDEVRYGVAPESKSYYFNVRGSYAPDVNISSDAVVTLDGQAAPIREESQLVPLDRDQVGYGAFNVKGEVTDATVATLQMHILGNDSPASAFTLYTGTGDSAKPMTLMNGKRSAEAGNYWITAANAPTIALNNSDKLEMNQDYIVNFVLPTTTSGGKNEFASAVQLVADGKAPTNRSNVSSGNNWGGGWWSDDDDSSSGCTIGSRPAYDLAILAALLMALIGLRQVRRNLRKN